MKARSVLALTVIVAWLSSPPLLAADDEVKALLKQLSQQVAELKEQSAKSDARILQLEKSLAAERAKNQQLATTPSPAQVAVAVATPSPAPEAKKDNKPAVTLGDVKGTLKIPGTDTSVGIGGFVKLDVLESSVSAGSNKLGDVSLFIPQIPTTHGGEDSQLAFTARESRLWFKSFTPSQWGDINTYLEMDFSASADSISPRLRHAYGSFGQFLAGQTWTTFMNTLALPDTLDTSGPVGSMKLRQPLVRWSQPFTIANQPFELHLAAESPNSALWTSRWSAAAAETLTSGGSDRYPDLVVRLNYKPNWGDLSLAAVGRQIRITPTTQHSNLIIPNVNAAHEVWGGAVSLAGKIDVFELDNLRFTLNYGDALGRYSTVDRLEDAAVDSDGNLHLVTMYNAVVAYQHWWNTAWRSTLAYGFEQADQPSFVNPAMTRQAQTVHANLLWSPLPQATLGVEYIYGSRELIDGRDGFLNRAQLSAKYNF